MAAAESLVRRWFEEVWNRKDAGAIDAMLTDDSVVHGVGPDALRGPAAFKPFHQAFVDAYPDLHIQVIDTVTEGDRVAVHFQATGTHRGAGLGGTPTGRPVVFHGMSIVRVGGERLLEGHNCIDFLTMYQQLGWVTPTLPA